MISQTPIKCLTEWNSPATVTTLSIIMFDWSFHHVYSIYIYTWSDWIQSVYEHNLSNTVYWIKSNLLLRMIMCRSWINIISVQTFTKKLNWKTIFTYWMTSENSGLFGNWQTNQNSMSNRSIANVCAKKFRWRRRRRRRGRRTNNENESSVRVKYKRLNP